MQTERLRLVTSNQFINTALNADIHTLSSQFNPQCHAIKVEPISTSDWERARAIHNAISANAERCIYDKYAFVYYWLYQHRNVHWDYEAQLNGLIDAVINMNVAYLFLDSTFFFDVNAVVEVYQQVIYIRDMLAHAW